MSSTSLAATSTTPLCSSDIDSDTSSWPEGRPWITKGASPCGSNTSSETITLSTLHRHYSSTTPVSSPLHNSDPTWPADEMFDIPLTGKQLAVISCGCAIFFTGAMHATSVSYLLPLIGEELGATAAETQWVMSGFSICWGSFALVSGRISDIYGFKRALMCGLIWTIMWNTISAFLPDIISISIARALSAIGFATASPAMTGIIGRYIPAGRPRTVAFSAMVGTGAVGVTMGYLVAGYLGEVEYNFRIVFGILGAILLYPLMVGYLCVPKDVPHPLDKKVDWLGAVLVVCTQLSLMLALSLGVTEGWTPFFVPLLFALFALFLIAFELQQWYLNMHARPGACPPLIPKRLLVGNGRGMLLAVYLGMILIFFGIDNYIVSGAYYYNQIARVSSRQAGIWAMPSGATGLAAAILVPFALPRMPSGVFLCICDVIHAAAPVPFALRSIDSKYYHFDLWAWLCSGVGPAVSLAVGNITISSLTAPEDQGIATASFVRVARFGASLGLAITTLARDAVTRRHSGWASGDEEQELFASEAGLRAAFWICAGCMFLGALIVLFGMGTWRPPVRGCVPAPVVQDVTEEMPPAFASMAGSGNDDLASKTTPAIERAPSRRSTTDNKSVAK